MRAFRRLLRRLLRLPVPNPYQHARVAVGTPIAPGVAWRNLSDAEARAYLADRRADLERRSAWLRPRP